MPDERKRSAVGFLEVAVGYFARLGVRVERVMTDNGSCYPVEGLSGPSVGVSVRVKSSPNPIGLRPRARPSLHPDRAWRIGLRASLPELAPASAELPNWLHRYNWHRPHGGLKARTPISRLTRWLGKQFLNRISKIDETGMIVIRLLIRL
jgi:transposase InsO family protein